MTAAIVRGTGKKVKLIIGYFDPLHSASAKRLRDLRAMGDCVVVAVDDPPEPLLSLRARQELVAALRTVDFVIPASEAGYLAPDEIVDERASDLNLRKLLVNQVLRKHSQR